MLEKADYTYNYAVIRQAGQPTHLPSTYTSGLKNLLQWLISRNCKDVCMESTGKYWTPIYNVLECGIFQDLIQYRLSRFAEGVRNNVSQLDIGNRETVLQTILFT